MLLEKLRRYRRSQQIIGFCKWKDGDALLFGRVLAVDEASVQFELVNPLGDFDENIVVALKDLSRVTESADYAKRLELFASLAPHEKGKSQTSRTRAGIRLCLVEAAKSGECVSLKLLHDNTNEYRVVRCDGDFVELEEYGDDPRKVRDLQVVRIHQIETLRWRTAGHLAVTRVWQSAKKKPLKPR